MTEGTLESRGKFEVLCSSQAVVAEEAHQTILAGVKRDNRRLIQTVTMKNTENKLGTVILKQLDEWYVFSCDIESMGQKIIWEIADIEPPAKIAGVEVQEKTVSSVTLLWTDSTDNEAVAGYYVYRNGILLRRVTGTTYQDIGLTPNKSYEYQISAVDEAGNESEKSDAICAVTEEDTEKPSVPKNVYIKDKTSVSATIFWDRAKDNAEIGGYIIYRDGEELARVSDVQMYKDTGLTELESYCYSVAAYDTSGNCSEMSEEVTVQLQKNEILAVAPEDGSDIGGDSQNLKVTFSLKGSAKGNKANVYVRRLGEAEWESLSPIWMGQKI